jgi:peptidoglycan/LPS O-acetylase OafA/YrhL
MSSRIVELDGLRGLAAVGVAYYHIQPEGTFWMWSFVDLFFVLSGYLITDILLRIDKWSFLNIRNFWIRRALRIWPIYYLTLFSVLAIWCMVAILKGNSISYFSGFRESLVFLHYLVGDYAELPKGVNYLYYFGHSWSLAVEEQFYLIWPLFLWFFREKAVLMIAFLISFVILVIYFRIVGNYPDYLLFTRADGLIMGSALAVLIRVHRRWFSHDFPQLLIALFIFLGLSVATLQLWPYLFAGYANTDLAPNGYSDRSELIFFFALFYASFVALVLFKLIPKLNQLLQIRPLVYLGSISYAIYMFHLPVQKSLEQFYNRGLLVERWHVEIIFWFVTLSLGALSRNYIEQRFELLKIRFPLHYRFPVEEVHPNRNEKSKGH